METLDANEADFVVEYPAEMAFGDYSTNVAMVLAKTEKKNPKELAEKFATKLNDKKIPEVGAITVAGPGFINFFLKPEVFASVVEEAIKNGSNVGHNKNLKGQKILVEYTDPNPFKEFHIGHLMSNAIGESISRIISAEGAEVKRACYQGDVGLHVAKAVWAMKNSTPDLKSQEYFPRESDPINKKIEFLGQAYTTGALAYENQPESKENINEINKKIYDQTDSEINDLYKKGRKWSLDYFETMYFLLGMKKQNDGKAFNFYFFESETGKFGKEIVEKNVGKIFEKSDGAIIFHGEKYDESLHTRVFINKDGLPTYEAKELGLSKIKYGKYSYDLSIIITGNEINDYFKVLLKAMSLIFPDLAVKTKHISHGMLRLPSGKMSSRTGDVITTLSLIDEIKNLILQKMSERKMSAEQKEKVAEEVATGALKFSILKQSAGKDIIFDFEKSVSFEGDSGPYLQYATVRANSILKKSGKISPNTKMPADWQTTNLEKMFERFESVVARAGAEYAPHYIVTYLVELASEFNSFYAKHKIIDKTDPTSPYKLALTQSFANIMTSGLDLLGIAVPEEM